MDIINFSVKYFLLYILVVFRVSGLMVLAPMYGSQNVPNMVKIGLSLLIAMPMSVLIAGMGIPFKPPLFLSEFVFYAAKELGVGLIIGFASTLLFAALQMAGQHIGQIMGFAIANVMDPISETQVSIIGQLYFFLGIVIFLSLGGHLALLAVLLKSFSVIPIGTMGNMAAIGYRLNDMFALMFEMSLRFAAPLMVVLFLLLASLGFIARTVPQMNVMIVGFPLQIAVGLAFVMLMLPILGTMFEFLWQGFYVNLNKLVYTMQTVTP